MNKLILISFALLLGCKSPSSTSDSVPQPGKIEKRDPAMATIIEDEYLPLWKEMIKNIESRFNIGLDDIVFKKENNKAYGVRRSNGKFTWGHFSDTKNWDMETLAGKPLPSRDSDFRDMQFVDQTYDNTLDGEGNAIFSKDFVVDGYYDHSLIHSRPKLWVGDRVMFQGKEQEVIGIASEYSSATKPFPAVIIAFALVAPPGSSDLKQAQMAPSKTLRLKKRFWQTNDFKALLEKDAKSTYSCDPDKLLGDWESVGFECQQEGFNGKMDAPEYARLFIQKQRTAFHIDFFRGQEKTGYFEMYEMYKPVRGTCRFAQNEYGLGGSVVGSQPMGSAGVIPGTDILEVEINPNVTHFCRGQSKVGLKQLVKFRRKN